MMNTAKAAPEKAAGIKTMYCKDCTHYNRIKKALWVECKILGREVRRKNTCDKFKNR